MNKLITVGWHHALGYSYKIHDPSSGVWIVRIFYSKQPPGVPYEETFCTKDARIPEDEKYEHGFHIPSWMVLA
jgi:hypothetical protein